MAASPRQAPTDVYHQSMFDRELFLARTHIEDVAGEPRMPAESAAIDPSSVTVGAALAEADGSSYDASTVFDSNPIETVQVWHKAIRNRWVIPYQIPDRMRLLMSETYEILDSAKRKGRDMTALGAVKLIKELHTENMKLVGSLDKAARLDAGKPTSITQEVTPETEERIRRIVSSQRAVPPPELVERAAIKARSAQDEGNV